MDNFVKVFSYDERRDTLSCDLFLKNNEQVGNIVIVAAFSEFPELSSVTMENMDKWRLSMRVRQVHFSYRNDISTSLFLHEVEKVLGICQGSSLESVKRACEESNKAFDAAFTGLFDMQHDF